MPVDTVCEPDFDVEAEVDGLALDTVLDEVTVLVEDAVFFELEAAWLEVMDREALLVAETED